MGIRRGCFNCSKRRILCDKTKPRCLKCIKKSLECSGNGVRYRFNDGIASRGKLRGLTVPILPDSRSNANDRRTPSNEGNTETSMRQVEKRGRRYTAQNYLSLQKRWYPYGQIVEQEHSEKSCLSILPCLELANSQVRMFLSHFSDVIAPNMVVLDGQHNGYRNLILPLALHDQLVQQAVVSVAGYNLWRSHPDLCSMADICRAKVIQKLKEASTEQEATSVFSVSTWVTLLVLLMGELILGGDHYIYLLRMMTSLKANWVHHENPEILQFLHTQTDLLTLLAQPFIDASSGVPMVSSAASLESMLYESVKNASSRSDQHIVSVVIEAGRSCFEIYRGRILFKRNSNTLELENLKRLISHVHPCTAGGNFLVWVYFIAAADSETIEHRAFFTSRLLDIYQDTRCANISTGIGMLEQLWKSQPEALWTRVLPKISTTFVM